MHLFNYIPRWLKSKYLITGISFIVWMVFFDQNDINLQLKRINELKKLQESEKNMDKLIVDTKKELDLLITNPSTLERYAREKFMMKRDNEDLYIIVKSGKNAQ
jgi:cell division protein DivIC